MNTDISAILRDWPYQPGQISARKITGDDGSEQIQLRLDLGLLQMAATGPPAGVRPHGYESLLDYYEYLLARYCQEGRERDGFTLDEQDCELLRNEGVMYYHRYLAEFVLEDYEAVIRDTMRNLRLMDFCQAHAAQDSDRSSLEQYRPYVLMMRTRALGLLAVKDGRPEDALAAIQKGIEDMKESCIQLDQGRLLEDGGELSVLRDLADEIEKSIPVDPIESVRLRLERAVTEERYEDAAGLRDKLRSMTGDSSAGRA